MALREILEFPDPRLRTKAKPVARGARARGRSAPRHPAAAAAAAGGEVYTAADIEVLEGLERSSIQEIEQIHSALQRIADGSYGECARCGKDIAEKRLEAVPYATTCIKCAPG